jgi:nicotinate-nucleotide adenylyltransferase
VEDSRSLAIFGGAFDPFHNGHVAVIRALLFSNDVAKVVVVPCGERLDKLNMSPAADRFQMALLGVREAFPGDDRVVVSDLQVTKQVGFATLDLVRYFALQSNLSVGVVIGHELLVDLPKWDRPDELAKEAYFLVVERPGVSAKEDVTGHWRIRYLAPLGGLAVDVSSTELRLRLSRGERCNGLLSETVAQYCISKGLYTGQGAPR